MLGIGPTQDVARVLNDRVLKSSARSEKRPPILTRKSNRNQSARHAAIGARGYTPEPAEVLHARRVHDLLSWNPVELNMDAHFIARKPKSHRNCDVRGHRRVIVAD